MAPRILLTTTLHWPFAARLAIAFANLGCDVESLCPHGHPLSQIPAVRKSYAHSVFRPLRSLRTAVRNAQADLVIPCDDNAAVHLQELHQSTSATDTDEAVRRERATLERSLGSPAACTLATARASLLLLAAQQGIRVPKTSRVTGAQELSDGLARRGFPAVMKVDNSWGGQGVSIVHSLEEGLAAYELRASGVSARRTLRRLLVERDSSAILDWRRPQQSGITVQDYIPGTPANRAVACWRGEVLAGISVEALHTLHSTGPATVVRVIQAPEMTEVAERLVRTLRISGLWGLDFILEEKSGAAYFIEMNPRATPICHLPLGAGQDLPAALYAQLSNSAPSPVAAITGQEIFALFPGEWHRDPSSPYLHSAFHDVPWDEPVLVQDGVKPPWAERGMLARILAGVSSKSSIPVRGRESKAPARLIVAGNRKYVR